MIYSNSQLAFHIAKKTNEVRESILEATNALNKVSNKLTGDTDYESVVNGCDIIMLGDPNETSMYVIISIYLHDIGSKYDPTLVIQYRNKESLVISLTEHVSTLDIAEWLMFHFDVATVWDISSEE
jgi:metal-dependent HD superfamily phosphatase/phosphodiesterase